MCMMCVYVGPCTTVCIGNSEDNLMVSVLSFYLYVGSWDQIQVTRIVAARFFTL